jgi:uroporphyrin-III C-methyltransferase
MSNDFGPGGRAGMVYLIGAGPGDPELLTLKAVRAIAAADVVLVDDLVGRGALDHARPGARIVEVGKRGGCRSTPQDFIERLMVRCARAGRIVARLKGGDPFVFGRGGEEIATLARAGVRVEIVPGVTAGIAVPALAGIPVTHRGLARGVTLVTAHTRDGGGPDWKTLAACGTTLVIYMGMSRIAAICEALMAGGLAGATPAAVLQSGSTDAARALFAPLESLAQRTGQEGFGSPAIIVIGEVVAFARTQWGDAPGLEQAA